MKYALALTLALVCAACSSLTPLPVQAGDTCYRCRRVIADRTLAAEIIDADGYALKFRTAGCLAQYLDQHAGQVRGIFVTDYSRGKMVRAEQAMFVRAEIDPLTHEMDYLAFTSVTDAVRHGRTQHSTPVDWLRVRSQIRVAAKSD